MRLLFAALLVSLLGAVQAAETEPQITDPLIKVESAHDVETTMTRLAEALESKGMTVFARINHAAGAEKVGEELRPTELLIFGNPKVGTPLMQCDQLVAIELPQKALVWEDLAGKTWLAYHNPQVLMESYLLDECKLVLEKVEGALANFAKAATQSE